MPHTAIALCLAMLPIASGCLAFAAAALIAAFRIRCNEAAGYSPEATPNESAEWAADLSESIDVDAEWCALADTCPDCGESLATGEHGTCEAETAAFVAYLESLTPAAAPEVHADCMGWPEYSCGACYDRAIAAAEALREAHPGEARIAASQGVSAARTRIVARMHEAQATTGEAPALTSGGKLTSAEASGFLTGVRHAIAAAGARRTLGRALQIAESRGMREAYERDITARAEADYLGIGTLERFAYRTGDRPELLAIEAYEMAQHRATLDAAAWGEDPEAPEDRAWPEGCEDCDAFEVPEEKNTAA